MFLRSKWITLLSALLVSLHWWRRVVSAINSSCIVIDLILSCYVCMKAVSETRISLKTGVDTRLIDRRLLLSQYWMCHTHWLTCAGTGTPIFCKLDMNPSSLRGMLITCLLIFNCTLIDGSVWWCLWHMFMLDIFWKGQFLEGWLYIYMAIMRAIRGHVRFDLLLIYLPSVVSISIWK